MWLFSVYICFFIWISVKHIIYYIVWLGSNRWYNCFDSVPVLSHTAKNIFVTCKYLSSVWLFTYWSLNLNHNFMDLIVKKKHQWRRSLQKFNSIDKNISKLTICTWNCKKSRIQTEKSHHRKRQRKAKGNRIWKTKRCEQNLCLVFYTGNA